MIKQYKLNSQRIIRLNPPKEFPVIGIKITEEAYVEDFVKKGIIIRYLICIKVCA